MYSYVKFSPVTYSMTDNKELVKYKRDFKELVCAKVLKKTCGTGIID